MSSVTPRFVTSQSSISWGVLLELREAFILPSPCLRLLANSVRKVFLGLLAVAAWLTARGAAGGSVLTVAAKFAPRNACSEEAFLCAI